MQKHLFDPLSIESIKTANIKLDKNGNLYNKDYNDVYFQKNHGIPESFYVYVKQSNLLNELTRQLFKFEHKKFVITSDNFLLAQDLPSLDPCQILEISNQKLLKRIKLLGKDLSRDPIYDCKKSYKYYQDICNMTDQEKDELHGLTANLRNHLLDNFVLNNKFNNSKVQSAHIFKVFELGFGSGLNCLLTMTSSYLYQQIKKTFANIAPKKIRDQIINSFEQVVPNQNIKDFTKLYDEFISQDCNQSWIKNISNPLKKDSAIFEFWVKDKDLAIDLLQILYPYYKQIISKFYIKEAFAAIIKIAEADYVMQYVGTEKTPIDTAQIRSIYRAKIIPEVIDYIPNIVTHVYESLFDLDFLLNFIEIILDPTLFYDQVSFKASRNYLEVQKNIEQQVILKELLSKPINKLNSLYRLDSIKNIFDPKDIESDEKYQRSRYKHQMENIAVTGIHILHKLMMMSMSKCYIEEYNSRLKSSNDSLQKQITNYIETFAKQLNNFSNQSYNISSFAQMDNAIIQVYYGDVVTTLKNNIYNFASQFNCIYLDGFDHKKNKDVWDQSIVCALAHIARPFATFTTFASVKAIKYSFINVGFELDKFKNTGFRKREMTHGRLLYPHIYLKSLVTILNNKNDTDRITNCINSFYNITDSNLDPYVENDLVCKRTNTALSNAANEKNNPITSELENNKDLIKSLTDYICAYNLPLRLFSRHDNKLKHHLLDIKDIKFNVWGAGIAGVTIANYLKSLNFDFTLIEKESQFKASCNTIGLIYPQLFDDDEAVTYLHNHAYALVSQKINYDFETSHLANPNDSSLDVKFLRWQYEYYRPIHVILNGYINNDYHFPTPKLPQLLFQYKSDLSQNSAFESFNSSILEKDVYDDESNDVIIKALEYKNINNFTALDEENGQENQALSYRPKAKSYYITQIERDLAEKINSGSLTVEDKVNQLFVENRGRFIISGYKCFVNEFIRANLYKLNTEHKYTFYPSEQCFTRKHAEKENKLLDEIEFQVFSDIDKELVISEIEKEKTTLNIEDTHSIDNYDYNSNGLPQVINNKYYNFVDYCDGFPVGRDYENFYEQVKAAYDEGRKNKKHIINIVATGSNLIHSKALANNGIYATSGKISIICTNVLQNTIKQTVNEILKPKHISNRLNRDTRESSGAELEINTFIENRLKLLFQNDSAYCSDCYHVVYNLSDLLLFNTQLNPSISTSSLYGISDNLNETIIVFGATHHRNEEIIKNISADNYYNVRKLLEKVFEHNDNIIPMSELEEIIETATNNLVQYMKQKNTFDLGCGTRVNLRDRMPFVGYLTNSEYISSLHKFTNKTYNPKDLPDFAYNNVSDELVNLVLNEDEQKEFNLLISKDTDTSPTSDNKVTTLRNYELLFYRYHDYSIIDFDYSKPPVTTYVVSGLGSRGLTLSRLLSIHAVHEVLGLVSPIPDGIAERMHPQRQLFKNILSGKLNNSKNSE